LCLHINLLIQILYIIVYYCGIVNWYVLFIKGEKNSKASVKIGCVCPSRIRLHKKESNIEVQYHSTHLWHANEIGKQRLHKNDRSQLAGT